MFLRLVMIQEASWHRDGMFMGGVHWAWWLFIIVGVAVVLWAFARVLSDRAATKKDAARMRQAEADLHARFERAEISEEQLTSQLAALLGTGTPHGER
jgi:uncharacterized membrane protein